MNKDVQLLSKTPIVFPRIKKFSSLLNNLRNAANLDVYICDVLDWIVGWGCGHDHVLSAGNNLDIGLYEFE